mmetsp:Transcript_35357/g.56441  ORF Transcript_35357/g.56441 Transcript_35357/m.56441 type:complete len:154 (-) Transcript_35357:80-541(-)
MMRSTTTDTSASNPSPATANFHGKISPKPTRQSTRPSYRLILSKTSPKTSSAAAQDAANDARQLHVTPNQHPKNQPSTRVNYMARDAHNLRNLNNLNNLMLQATRSSLGARLSQSTQTSCYRGLVVVFRIRLSSQSNDLTMRNKSCTIVPWGY